MYCESQCKIVYKSVYKIRVAVNVLTIRLYDK